MEIENRHNQSGFSLLEILIGLVLGLLVIAGILQVFSATSQSSRTQEALSRIQENGRFIMEYVKPRIRMAGRNNGCAIDLTRTVNHLDPDGVGYVDTLFDPDEALSVWEYIGTAPTAGADYALTTPAIAGAGGADEWENHLGEPLPTILASRAIAGSDVIVLRYAEPIAGVTACNNNNLTRRSLNVNIGGGCPSNTPPNAGYNNDELELLLPQGSMLYVTDCNNADMFQRTNNANGSSLARGNGTGQLSPGNVAGSWSTIYDENAQIFTTRSLAFYVGISATTGEPALFQLNLGNEGLLSDPEELVSGVENMQIMMGIALGQVVGYYAADNAAIDATTIGRLMGLQISFLLRTEGGSAAESNVDSATYDMAGITVDPIDDYRLRKVFHTTVAIRNGPVTVL